MMCCGSLCGFIAKWAPLSGSCDADTLFLCWFCLFVECCLFVLPLTAVDPCICCHIFVWLSLCTVVCLCHVRGVFVYVVTLLSCLCSCHSHLSVLYLWSSRCERSLLHKSLDICYMLCNILCLLSYNLLVIFVATCAWETVCIWAFVCFEWVWSLY